MRGAAPRRLAVVLDACHPWNTGGKERRHHEIMTRLVDRGYVVDVYTMRFWEGGDSTVVDGITFHAIGPRMPLYAGARRSILQAVVFALCTVRLITRRFDVMEVDAIPFLQLFPLRIVTWLRRKPMVVTWHEYWGRAYWVDYMGPMGHLAATFERVAVGLPDRVIAASEGTADRLRELGPKDLDLRVVPNGVDVRHLRALADALGEDVDAVPTPRADHAGPHLVSIGRLLDHKKVDVALRAVARLRADGGTHRLTVVGEGPERDRLHALADELGLGDAVEFHGFLPEHADVLHLLSTADVLLFPSTREGFGMAALESMAVGTPVVTSNHPDNLARLLVLTGVNGAVCLAEPEPLADATASVLADRRALAQGALTTAQSFDWDQLADQAALAYAA